MNQTIAAVHSAVKATAPIVAIPVEGHAPFCINAKLLKGALKGVTIQSAEVERIENEYFEGIDKVWIRNESPDGSYRGGEYIQPEGPKQRKVSVHFALRIRGFAKGEGLPVRTSCKFNPIARRVAIETLAKWSTKEREKLSKKKILAVGTGSKERAKLAKYVTTHIDGDDAKTFLARNRDKSTFAVTGLPIRLNAWPELSFFIHSSIDLVNGHRYDWRISEQSSGMSAAAGHDTALKAIEAAELSTAKCNREVALKNIAENQMVTVEAVAA